MKQIPSVLFINLNSYPCDIGGLEVFNFNLIENLKDHFNIKVLTYCDRLKIDSVRINRIKRYKWSRLSKPVSIATFLLKYRKEYDIIHISFSRSHWLYWLVFVFINKLVHKKYIITIHGGGLTKWKPSFVYKWLFKNASVITGVSQRIIDEYSKRSKREIIYTPPLVPFEIQEKSSVLKEKWNIDEEKVVMLYVGSLKKLKSVDTLIDGLGLIDRDKLIKLKIKVLIAGDGLLKTELMERSMNLDLDDFISFLGNVSQKSLPELYAIADFYSICSEYEGLPISMLQAFANGLPCLSSNAPGLSNLSNNNENSLLFELKNPEDFSRKLLDLMENVELKISLKNKSKKFYQNNFSYDLLLDQFISIIEDVYEH